MEVFIEALQCWVYLNGHIAVWEIQCSNFEIHVTTYFPVVVSLVVGVSGKRISRNCENGCLSVHLYNVHTTFHNYSCLQCDYITCTSNVHVVGSNPTPRINQSINQYVFQDFLQGYCWQVIWFITVNNPRTDIGKPVFMTDLQMHWYKLCDDNLENNDTIFGESNYNI